MRFAVLGPVGVTVGDHTVTVARSQRRGLLAYLLLHANQLVSADALTEALWGGAAPNTARKQIQTAVHALRVSLREATSDEVLTGDGGGYELRVGDDQLDLFRFRAATSRAEAASRRGEHPTAARELRAGLALWRGEALGNASGAYVESARAHLGELRLTAIEDLVEAELAQGHDVLPEFGALVDEYPTRERLRGLVMRALYRAGRPTEALAGFRDLRRALVEEHGVEPGKALRALHEAILREDADLDGGPSGPAQLPPTPPEFVGRTRLLSTLDELVARPDRTTAATVVISAVTGGAGVGKTALAVHWGQTRRRHFPDGQLYVNLRGYAPIPPLRPIEALDSLLRGLGVAPGHVPESVDDAAALLRSRLAGRRVLLLLDNANDADQVRPLLPATPGCVAVVTSRSHLAGLVALQGARPMPLDVLGPDEAVALLGQLLGAARVAAEPEATAQLAALCGRLPLALRVAVANLALRPEESIAAFVAGIRAVGRLSALAITGDEQASVRAAFSQSYAVLEGPARRMFRLLGLVPGPDVTAPAAAALADVGIDEATRLLDRLSAAHLVDRTVDRFASHDLLRDYARERVVAEETPVDRDAALRRLFDWYVRHADAATNVLHPYKVRLPMPVGGTPVRMDQAAAGPWLDDERANLVAATVYAAEHGPRPYAWLLGDTLRGYFWHCRHDVDWRTTAGAALAAATADGDLAGQASAEFNLSGYAGRLGRTEASIEHTERAVAYARRAGWTVAVMAGHSNLGDAYWQLGRLDDAEHHLSAALELTERPSQRAIVVGSLAAVAGQRGQLRLAAQRLREAIALDLVEDSLGPLVYHRRNLGQAYAELGDLAAAQEQYEQALELTRVLNDQQAASCTHQGLAALHLDQGNVALAHEHAQTALSLAEQTHHPYFEALAHHVLGCVLLRDDRPTEAREHLAKAVEIADEGGFHRVVVEARVDLATAVHRLGDVRSALDLAHLARTASLESHFAIPEAHALATLATLYEAAGDPERAHRHAAAARAIYRSAEHRLATVDPVSGASTAG